MLHYLPNITPLPDMGLIYKAFSLHLVLTPYFAALYISLYYGLIYPKIKGYVARWKLHLPWLHITLPFGFLLYHYHYLYAVAALILFIVSWAISARISYRLIFRNIILAIPWLFIYIAFYFASILNEYLWRIS